MLIWINLEDKAKKMAQFGLNWSHWTFVNLTGLYSNHLLADIDNILKVLNDI